MDIYGTLTRHMKTIITNICLGKHTAVLQRNQNYRRFIRMQSNQFNHKDNGSTARHYVRRLMRTDDLVEAFRLVEQESWNVTLTKFRHFYNTFPSCVFVTIKRDTQEVVALINASPSFPGQYVLGNLVVRTDHRSRGLGKSMVLYLLSHLQHTGPFSVTLMAVPGVDQFYRKLGFHAIDPSHIVNYVKVDRSGVKKASREHNTDGTTISEYTSDMFQALNSYDTRARGYDCGRYLSVMTEASDTFLLATNTGSGQVKGYAAGVNEPSLLLIDGLYADNDAIAMRLYCTLLDTYPNQQMIKIEEIQSRDFLSRFGDILPKSHNLTRMTNGPVTPVRLSKLYAACDCGYAE